MEVDVKLVDSEGTLMSNENSASTRVSLHQFTSASDPGSTQSAAPTNKIRNNIVQAINGTFHFDNLLIQLPPQSLATLNFQVQGIADNGFNSDFVNHPHPLIIFSRDCISGESHSPVGTCDKCPQGTYLLDPPLSVQPCKVCDVKARCNGTN